MRNTYIKLYIYNNMIPTTDIQTLEQKITEFSEILSLMIPDIESRFNMIGKMLTSDNPKFEYFGDRHLTMNDFWDSLTDMHRMALLGSQMNQNALSHSYGRYKEMMIGLSAMIEMFEKNMKDNPEGLPIEPIEKPSNIYH